MGTQFIRLSSDSGFSIEPSLSRDGTLVVYASDRAGDGQLDLWLQRTAGGQPIRLTDDPADDREPAFSPDGSLIAFRSNRGVGGVYVLPTLGGNARLVAATGRDPRFSPDGGRLLYWTGPWLGNPRTAGSAIFVVPAIGGQPTRIAEGFWTARNPIWSPDGRSVLFFGSKSGESDSDTDAFDWWWTSMDGGDPVATGAYPLMTSNGLSGSTLNDVLPAVWTEAGVLFPARLGDSVNLWRVSISDSSGKAIDTSLERLTLGVGSDLLPSVDATGRIAFQVTAESLVSLTLPLEPNAGRATGAVRVEASGPGEEETFRNSLDDAGRLLAYPRSRGDQSELWVKDLKTGQEQHIVTTRRSLINPVMSHDGAKVAYTVTEGATIAVAGYVIPTAGGSARKVCDGCSLQGWFADNTRILTLNSTSPRVRAVNVVDGTTTDLITDPMVGRVDVSRDSRFLSFSSRRQVWVAPLNAEGPIAERDWTPVISMADGSGERACGWSPDGRLLYLLLERDGFRDLYAQRIDPARGAPIGEPFVVQHLHDPRRRWGSTPFGTAIVSNAFVFHQVEATGSIWLMDPYLATTAAAPPQ